MFNGNLLMCITHLEPFHSQKSQGLELDFLLHKNRVVSYHKSRMLLVYLGLISPRNWEILFG